MPKPSVLFVSKPIAPPWNDGSKNLVRDVAAHLTRTRSTVMTTPGAPIVGDDVTLEYVYNTNTAFAPALLDNARVLGRLLSGDDHDVWCFVFAPNPRSSWVARGAILAARARLRRHRIVQVVASAPASFSGVSRLLFGDVIVATSEYTRGCLLGAGVTKDVRVIAPCARRLRHVTPEEIAKVRSDYELDEGPIVLYPGDYEFSTGAMTMTRAIAPIIAARPDARVLYACRAKTAESHAVRADIEAEILDSGLGPYARHVGDVPDMAPLIAASSVVAFPVDDLHGKVDVPLVLLEAMAMRKPIVVCRGGPLTALTHAPAIGAEDDVELAREILAFLGSAERSRRAGEEGETLYDACFSPEKIAAQYDKLFAEITR